MASYDELIRNFNPDVITAPNHVMRDLKTNRNIGYCTDFQEDLNNNPIILPVLGQFYPAGAKITHFEGTLNMTFWKLTTAGENVWSIKIGEDAVGAPPVVIQTAERSSGKRLATYIGVPQTSSSNLPSRQVGTMRVTLLLIKIIKHEGYPQ